MINIIYCVQVYCLSLTVLLYPSALPIMIPCIVNIGRWVSIRLRHVSSVTGSGWICLLDLFRMPLN